jgi:outer membrane protein assembly factor BamB
MPSKFISSARRRRRRWPFVLAALALLGAGGAVAVYLVFFQKESNFVCGDCEFNDQQPAKHKPKPKPETFKWPIYGYDPGRTRHLDLNVAPPARKLWTFPGGSGLIEFQPVLANGFLYYVNNSGMAFAINAKNGKRRWKRKVGALNASSPAWNSGRLYIVTLKRNTGTNAGSIICLNSKNGKKIWSKHLASRAESSPIVRKGVVYFGSEDGTVYALGAKRGRKIWTYHAGGAVKGGLAYADGNLYFGAYGGSVTAVRAKNGSRVWSSGTSGASFNRSGNFYGTPAVAYGRVYLGNTDSFVYSFVARTGALAWRRATGDYVYSAPAVGTVPKLGPTVFIGSYDGYFYALDAKDGSVDWRYGGGGRAARISGAPTIVGNTVYYSNLGRQSTIGVDVRSGKRVWYFRHGAFNPIISDGRRFYLTTYSTVFGMAPKGSKEKAVKEKPKKKQQPPKKKSHGGGKKH